ncbi:MAG: DUF3616 domain-containing protein [Xanthobacteraceae bacterium]|nr:DUF3616 domain-containing protein [Xanthobacteraceae bacterium]
MHRIAVQTTILMALCWGTSFAQQGPAVRHYPDMCDASAAVALDENYFIVAGDEDNILRVHRRDKPGEPLRFDLSGPLKIASQNPEMDIEGAARIGKTVYWITSHGQNRNAKSRPNRHRFFATDISVTNGKVEMNMLGFYSGLRNDLIKAPALGKYNLAAAAALAPEAKGGFNIEGLAATPDGKLLIGFRNPIVGSAALLVPLDNPQDVIKGAQARFGDPVELALGGRGIRSIEYSPASREYLIVAGPFDDAGTFALYRWSGRRDDRAPKPIPQAVFGDLRPEAMFFYPNNSTTVQFLSDDGGEPIGKQQCKDAPKAMQRFRSLSVDLR